MDVQLWRIYVRMLMSVLSVDCRWRGEAQRQQRTWGKRDSSTEVRKAWPWAGEVSMTDLRNTRDERRFQYKNPITKPDERDPRVTFTGNNSHTEKVQAEWIEWTWNFDSCTHQGANTRRNQPSMMLWVGYPANPQIPLLPSDVRNRTQRHAKPN